MASFTYNERFTNVRKYDSTNNTFTGIKIASKLNQKNGEDYKLVDVTDLDWQGAWLAAAGAYINDTYELLDAIDNIADLAELTWVKNKVNELDENVTNIINILPSYLTKEEFDEVISKQQKALTPGAYITIDEDNVISAYDLLSIADAEALYTTKERHDSLVNLLLNDYYNKVDSYELIKEISYSDIQNLVIKDADIRYNDLGKISNWILSQSKYIKVDYDDIDPDSGTKYYIYDESTKEYIEVDKEYIESHPDAEYYIEQQLVDDLAQLNNRVTRLDEVVGYAIYEDGMYTYSGLLGEVDSINKDISLAFVKIGEIENTTAEAITLSNMAYGTSNVAYDMAYYAYEMSLLSDAYAYIAYVMAKESKEIIGNPTIPGYLTELTQEEIEKLSADPYLYKVYYTDSSNPDEVLFGYFNLEKYNSGEREYFTYTEAVPSTGFYNRLENVDSAIAYAQETADNALFGLHGRVEGSSYVDITFDPDIKNELSNDRTIVLGIDEADISPEDGKILKDGFITTYSLYNSFSYYSKIIIL